MCPNAEVRDPTAAKRGPTAALQGSGGSAGKPRHSPLKREQPCVPGPDMQGTASSADRIQAHWNLGIYRYVIY